MRSAARRSFLPAAAKAGHKGGEIVLCGDSANDAEAHAGVFSPELGYRFWGPCLGLPAQGVGAGVLSLGYELPHIVRQTCGVGVTHGVGNRRNS